MPKRPPLLARTLLRLLAGRSAEPIEGDLFEGISDRGSAWYWSQVIRSAPHLLVGRLSASRTAALGKGLGLGAITFVALFSVGIIGATSLFAVVPMPEPFRLATYLGVLFMASATSARVASRLAHGPVAGWVMGCVAILFVLILFVASPEPEPLAAQVLWPLIALVGSSLGAHATPDVPESR